MASIINASTSAGLISTADTSGILQLQTANTTALTITASQNVGIGTASPSAFGAGYTSLTVQGSSSGFVQATNGTITTEVGTFGGIGYTGTRSNHSYGFVVNGSEQMRLTSTGLSIGTSTVNYGLTVQKDNGSGYIAAFRASAGNPYITLQTTGGITQIQGINSAFTDVNNIAMQLSGGNVGIGTSSPATKLEVAGASPILRITDTTSAVTGGTYGSLEWKTSDVSAPSGGIVGKIDVYDDIGIYGDRGAMRFYTNDSGSIGERARISSGGNLLVGTTTTISGVVGIFQNSSNTFRNFLVTNTVATGNSGTINSVLGANASSTSSYHFVGNTATVDKIYIYGNGNIVNVNNSYGSLSDAKLKENIVNATPKLADLMQVKVRNYNLIGDTTKQLGVVAQELETVFPAMVDESPDRDGDGNDLGTTTKQVKYSVFVPMLIKALQEQQALITQLQTDVATLKGN